MGCLPAQGCERVSQAEMCYVAEAPRTVRALFFFSSSCTRLSASFFDANSDLWALGACKTRLAIVSEGSLR